jgi:hypothetical protein
VVPPLLFTQGTDELLKKTRVTMSCDGPVRQIEWTTHACDDLCSADVK